MDKRFNLIKITRTQRWKLKNRKEMDCLICGRHFDYPANDVNRKYCSEECQHQSLIGRKESPEHIKMRISKIGKKRKKYVIQSYNNGWKNLKKGSEHHSWKGGITSINEKIRKSNEYKKWREIIFVRDNYTCQICGKKGTILNADHIKPFAYYPEFRFDINNGRTLCFECHKETETFMYKARWNYVQI